MLYRQGSVVPRDDALATSYFEQSCELKFKAACINLLNSNSIARDDPHELDLRLLLREGGLNLMDVPLSDLYVKACGHNWDFACQKIQVSL
jgi:TPR repeat protein